MRVPSLVGPIVALSIVLLSCAEPRDRAGAPESAAASGAASRDAYTFTTIDYPGATATVAADVTDGGAIVGWYERGDTTRGFVHESGQFRSVEYPGVAFTQVNSMSADGSLAGAYRRPGEGKFAYHGFVRRADGPWVEIRHEKYPYSMAQRILDDGTVIGCYHGEDFAKAMWGMVVRGDSMAVNPATGSMNSGATSNGRRVVGLLAGEGRGFSAEGGNLTYLEAPGSSSTEAWDINDAGLVVGAMVDSAGRSRGFVLEAARWTPLDIPGARSVVAFGINARGDVVGAFDDSTGRSRAFIARRP